MKKKKNKEEANLHHFTEQTNTDQTLSTWDC